jgi:hypothetical protein
VKDAATALRTPQPADELGNYKGTIHSDSTKRQNRQLQSRTSLDPPCLNFSSALRSLFSLPPLFLSIALALHFTAEVLSVAANEKVSARVLPHEPRCSFSFLLLLAFSSSSLTLVLASGL